MLMFKFKTNFTSLLLSLFILKYVSIGENTFIYADNAKVKDTFVRTQFSSYVSSQYGPKFRTQFSLTAWLTFAKITTAVRIVKFALPKTFLKTFVNSCTLELEPNTLVVTSIGA